MQNELKLCPFCGNKIRIIVCDDEGNEHDTDAVGRRWNFAIFGGYRQCP